MVLWPVGSKGKAPMLKEVEALQAQLAEGDRVINGTLSDSTIDKIQASNYVYFIFSID